MTGRTNERLIELRHQGHVTHSKPMNNVRLRHQVETRPGSPVEDEKGNEIHSQNRTETAPEPLGADTSSTQGRRRHVTVHRPMNARWKDHVTGSDQPTSSRDRQRPTNVIT